MTLSPEQIAELQAKAAEAEQLKRRLDGLNENKAQILDEKKKLQGLVDELTAKEKDRETKKLEQEGDLQKLLEAAREEIASLKAEIAKKDAEIQDVAQSARADKARARFVAALAAEAFAPEQLWTFFKDGAELGEGGLSVVYKGAKTTVDQLSKALRADSEYAHHFKPLQEQGGMGASSARPHSTAESGVNPWITGNVTQQIYMRVNSPDLAAKLMHEAESLSTRANAGRNGSRSSS